MGKKYLVKGNVDEIIAVLKAHPELVKALEDILSDWSERMHNEIEEFKPANDERPGYWSPSSSLVSSSVIAKAREALKNIHTQIPKLKR